MPITLEEQSGDWKDKFAELCSKSHTDQAKWFLNGFWEDFQEEGAQKIWDITHKFMEIQLGFPVLYGGKMRAFEEGCDLDELQSHRVLEEFGNTMTVIELRRRLKNLDIDNNKRMALTEYLLDLYRKSPKDVVNAPQGNVDPVELKAAENAFQTASEKLEQSQADARVAQEVLEEAKKQSCFSQCGPFSFYKVCCRGSQRVEGVSRSTETECGSPRASHQSRHQGQGG